MVVWLNNFALCVCTIREPCCACVPVFDVVHYDFMIIFTGLKTNSTASVLNQIQTKLKQRKELFYLTMHSTHFVYGYMASDIW